MKIALILLSIIFALTIKGSINNYDIKNLYLEQHGNYKPPFETSMERGRFAHTASIVNFRTFNVNNYSDFLKPDIAWYGGNYYPAFPPGISIISSPFYFIGNIVGANQLFSFVPTIIITILSAVVVVKILGLFNLSSSTKLFVFSIYLFSTSAWAYGVSISAHNAAALFIGLSTYYSIKISRNNCSIKELIILGIILGLSLLVDYPVTAVISSIIVCGLLLTIKFTRDHSSVSIFISNRWLIILLSFFVGMIPYLAYNKINYNKFITFTNTYNIKRLEIQGVKFSEDNLNNSLFESKKYKERFTISRLSSGINTLLFSRDRGLFLYSPVLIPSILGLIFMIINRKKELLIILLPIIVNLLIYGSFDDPWGGWGFGPRYMIGVLPSILLLFSVAYEKYLCKNSIFKTVIVLLFIVSVFINSLGAITTNAVPTGIEGKQLGLSSNYYYNFEKVINGEISSLIYTLIPFNNPFVYLTILNLLICITTIYYMSRLNKYEN